jgi:phage terminase large subunit-like protein
MARPRKTPLQESSSRPLTKVERIKEQLKKKSPEELRDLYEKVQEYNRRRNENLCKKFIPNVKSEEFIKNIGNDEIFINLFCAANGVGKTATLCNIVANIVFGAQSPYFEPYPLYNNWPYVKKGRIISDPTTIAQMIIPELKKWFPSNRDIKRWWTKKEGKNYEAKFLTASGWEIDLMTTEQQAKEFESVTLGFVALDEPCPKDIYTATIARMRTGGILFWTLTPLSYSAWIKDEIYDKRDGKFVEVVTASVWDNCKDIPNTRGVLTRENIDKMISQYPHDERESRIEGKFGHLLGRVHKMFDERIHVIKPFKITPDKFVVAKAHDTHPRVEDHINWIAIDEKGTKYIVNELAIKGTTAEMAAQIKMIEKNEGYRMIDHLIDPSAFNEDKRAVTNPIAHQFWDEGIDYRRGSKDLAGCIQRFDDALYYEEKDNHLVVAPELYILDTCRGTINQLNSYVWDNYHGKSADEKQPKPKPKDKNDHFVENVHRLVMENYQFEPIRDKFQNNKEKNKFRRQGFNRAY